MPAWEPNWNNVRWDHGAADDAALALRRAADLLEETAARREQLAREAQAEWKGRFREEFDERLVYMLRRARQLAQEYRAKATEILQKSQMAYEEQKHRERERERWRREKEEEERALSLQQGGG